jgi:hypothetical protein
VVNIQSCDITLRLADNKTHTTNGIVWLPVSINQQVQAQFYILTETVYPVILGCEFLEKNHAVLRFYHDRRELELTSLILTTSPSKPILKLIEPLQLPSFSSCFTECSVNIKPDLQGTYIIEPNNELFGDKGIFISRGVVEVGCGPILHSIANVTGSELTLENDEILGELESCGIDTSDGMFEILGIKT